MPNPRNTVSFVGCNAEYLTFKSDNSTIVYDSTKASGSASVGLAVTLSTDNTVALVNDNDKVIGKLISVSADNKATVQVKGGMTLPAGTSASISVGKSVIGALLSSAKGYIKEVPDSAGTYAAGEQDNISKGRGFIVDNDTSTAVVVYL